MRPILPFALLAALFTALASIASAQPSTMTCSPNTTIAIRGDSAPPATALLLTFGGRTVGGGVSDAQGSYQLALQLGRERPGSYRVAVVERSHRETIQAVTCVVPGTATPTAPRPTAPATGRATPAPSPTRSPDPSVCDPSYPTVCIAPPPPQLSCTVIPYRDFAVLQPDPHKLDGDKDGIGCESD